MAKWDKRFNPPPVRRNPKLERMGSKVSCVERILTTYVETGRSVRSLAAFYGCSKSTIGRYINEYAREEMSYHMYEQARRQARANLSQGSNDTDEYGSMD